MRFSIIINTHNQSAFIRDCINSCINQKYSNFEIIITDTSNQRIDKKNLNLDYFFTNLIFFFVKFF